MASRVVRLANDWLPPALLRLWRRVRRSRYGFFGSYPSYAEALTAAGGPGYADSAMVDTLVRRQRELISGPPASAPMELDDRWLHLQMALAHALSQAPNGELRVLDFGGGAGVHYFDVVRWRERSGWPAGPLRWDVCETTPMAAAGQAALANSELTFHDSLDPLEGAAYDLVYVSGSLQYVPDAEDDLGASRSSAASLAHAQPHGFHRCQRGRVCRAARPCAGWGPGQLSRALPRRAAWLKRMAATHDLVARWPVREHGPYLEVLRDVRYEGMLLRRR